MVNALSLSAAECDSALLLPYFPLPSNQQAKNCFYQSFLNAYNSSMNEQILMVLVWLDRGENAL
jgi:hypothetical protein